MGTPKMVKYRYQVCAQYLHRMYRTISIYLINSWKLIQYKHTYIGELVEIILIIYRISILSLAFDENSGGGGQKK